MTPLEPRTFPIYIPRGDGDRRGAASASSAAEGDAGDGLRGRLSGDRVGLERRPWRRRALAALVEDIGSGEPVLPPAALAEEDSKEADAERGEAEEEAREAPHRGAEAEPGPFPSEPDV